MIVDRRRAKGANELSGSLRRERDGIPGMHFDQLIAMVRVDEDASLETDEQVRLCGGALMCRRVGFNFDSHEASLIIGNVSSIDRARATLQRLLRNRYPPSPRCPSA